MKDKASLWHLHIRNQQKSSLTIQDYCNQHRLSSGTFYYWKGKLRQQKETLTFKEVHIMEPSINAGGYSCSLSIWYRTLAGQAN